MRKIILLLVTSFLFTACGGSQKNQGSPTEDPSITPNLTECKKRIDSSTYRSLALSFAKMKSECGVTEDEAERLAAQL